ncbi:hypothetical protein [Thiorhodococcus drewsii]|uniref:hypothetical protein n=1 Tax=Thiorhodococcus drewsii TaxID=210408 RepID=UPI0002D5FD60|nr:hypothetical protein [Thiorhodococcus drewsii]
MAPDAHQDICPAQARQQERLHWVVFATRLEAAITLRQEGPKDGLIQVKDPVTVTG